MNQVDVCIEQLVAAVLESEEYKQYHEIKEKIRQNPEKEQAINEFRRRNFTLQKKKDNIDLFREIECLEREFAPLLKEALVKEYLDAELAFCRLIQKINWKLMERVEFDAEVVE